MGNQQATVSKPDIDRLSASSHFDRKELNKLYKHFKSEVKTGEYTKEHFMSAMESIGVTDGFFKDLVFKTLDENQSGTIGFDEFIMFLSTVTRGNLDEKLEFAFNLYDLDGSGTISKEELLQIVRSLYSVATATGKPVPQVSAEDFTETILKELDENGDGLVTLKEYKNGMTKNPDLMQGLSAFN
eukprot:TRINITY_DN17296_c0_g1_i1.p1 TRINITY_DN17296_c0_g1~~TRINITY_DN17296_c0_g1_i1.p1  ORF type:complete len:185 (+),score=53.75 TRINITY_DN17296_c0_g1_i1:68-622(+)